MLLTGVGTHGGGAGAAFPRGGWTPLDLGSLLYAWWGAERTDLITMSSGAVSSCKDAVAGYNAVQATGSAQPLWSAAGFNTRAGVTFDGTDDYLAYESMTGIPSGTTPCEEWYAVDQKTLAAVTSSTWLGASGGTTLGNSRSMVRAVVSGANRARAVDSNSGTATQGAGGDFSGRHVVRSIMNGSTLGLEVDGVAVSPVANTPAIATVRVRFGASYASSPGSFGNFTMADRLFTALLSAAQAAQVYSYLARGV